MAILLVDDSKSLLVLLKHTLQKAGFTDLLVAESAEEGFKHLGMGEGSGNPFGIDLIILDIVMPELDGIEACRRIKADETLQDIPIIMVTGQVDTENLESAFKAGAIDYVTKPFNKVELLARVGAVLKLKYEMDRRKEVALQLEEANKKLQLLSSLDGLTGIANRRSFDDFISKEWRRNLREEKPVSLILMDIDFFKKYNDGYGHQAGDDCLKQVAQIINGLTKRASDLAARYGGEEFVVTLPDTTLTNATRFAENLRKAVEDEQIAHEYSGSCKVVTISLGVSSVIPTQENSPGILIGAADQALYLAKNQGRNRVKVTEDIPK